MIHLDDRTGCGVKIGILDTGIADLPELNPYIRGYYRIVDEKRKLRVDTLQRGEDRLNHGTVCADIIHRHAPEAELYSIQVMDYKAENSKYKLAAGIRFAIEQGWNLLNISVGTPFDFERLREVTEQAEHAGLVLVSAIECNAPQIGFPAGYPTVISVDYDLFENPLEIGLAENADVLAHGIYVDALDAEGSVQSFTGSSYACPHVTAIVAKLMEANPELTPKAIRAKLNARLTLAC